MLSHVIRNAGGLYDFTVQCDNNNNPNAAANAGILVVTLVLIPQIPIHEIQLQVVISKRGVSFNETLASLNGTAAN
jgi:phage tail sheath protein FI